VHVSETCEPTRPHLLTHVHTTPATVHEAQCTTPIQQALVDKDVPPREHVVDAAYISSELLVHSRDAQGAPAHMTQDTSGKQVLPSGFSLPHAPLKRVLTPGEQSSRDEP